MTIDEQTHVALPRLMGAPAYARPPRPIAQRPRPFDPDDLPIEADRTEDERQLLEALPAGAFAPGGVTFDGPHGHPGNGHGRPVLEPRPFRLRTLAGRFLRRAG